MSASWRCWYTFLRVLPNKASDRPALIDITQPRESHRGTRYHALRIGYKIIECLVIPRKACAAKRRRKNESWRVACGSFEQSPEYGRRTAGRVRVKRMTAAALRPCLL